MENAIRRVIAPYVQTVRKHQKSRKESENEQFSYYLKKKPNILLQDLSMFLSDSVDLPSVLHETAEILKSVTQAAGSLTFKTIY